MGNIHQREQDSIELFLKVFVVLYHNNTLLTLVGFSPLPLCCLFVSFVATSSPSTDGVAGVALAVGICVVLLAVKVCVCVRVFVDDSSDFVAVVALAVGFCVGLLAVKVCVCVRVCVAVLLLLCRSSGCLGCVCLLLYVLV
jgi:hypothetical protein